AQAIDVIPRLAGAAREVLAAELVDELLILLGELVPFVFVDEEAERRAVETAGEEGRVLDQAVELERDDRFLREEHSVGDSRGKQLVGLGRRLDEGRGAERARHRLGDAAAGAD